MSGQASQLDMYEGVTPQQRQRGLWVMGFATLGLVAVFIFESLYKLEMTSSGSENWRILGYAYVAWQLASGRS